MNQFEDQIAQSNGIFEPQRQHTWLITFYGVPGSRRLELALRTGFLPNESNEEIEIPYMNSKVYVAGKYNVDAGSITFNDYCDINIAKIIKNWRLLIYEPVTGRMGYAAEYKRAAEIQLYGPDLLLARSWYLQGIWPQSVNFGSIDYSSSDVVQIECTFRYDKAIDRLGVALAL